MTLYAIWQRNGIVKYRKADTPAGTWLEAEAAVSNGQFTGFDGKADAVEVIIPGKDSAGNNITGIRNEAFRSCHALVSVTIPNSVTSIGDSAFEDCSGLASVTIPHHFRYRLPEIGLKESVYKFY